MSPGMPEVAAPEMRTTAYEIITISTYPIDVAGGRSFAGPDFTIGQLHQVTDSDSGDHWPKRKMGYPGKLATNRTSSGSPSPGGGGPMTTMTVDVAPSTDESLGDT
jgi:hypothetical protein